MYAKKTDLRRAALLHARAADADAADAADAAAPPMTPRARAVTARAYSSSSHWLPSRARSWLDDIENAAFTKTLKAQLDLVPALAGRGDAIAARVRERADALCRDDDVARAMGDAEATHTRTAARALATFEATRSFLGNDDAAMALIRSLMGAERTAVTFNGGLVRGALLLSVDKRKTLAGMASNVCHDLAPGAWSREDDDNAAVTTFATTTCTYHAFFKRYDVEFLTAATCCSLDVPLWFGDVAKTVARVELAESMARGDARCCIRVSQGATDASDNNSKVDNSSAS
jgi:hypothetical protein